MYDIKDFTEKAGVAMVAFDPQTKKFTRVNEHFINLVGYPEERLLNEVYSTFLFQDDLESSEEFIKSRKYKITKLINYVNRYVHGITGEIVTLMWITDSLGYINPGMLNTSFVINLTTIVNEYDAAVQKKEALLELFRIINDK